MATTIACSPGNAVMASWLEPAVTAALDEQGRLNPIYSFPIFFSGRSWAFGILDLRNQGSLWAGQSGRAPERR